MSAPLLSIDQEVSELVDLKFETDREIATLAQQPVGEESAAKMRDLRKTLDATEQALVRVMASLPQRVDGAAWYIRELEARAAAKREVAKRLLDEARALEAQQEWFEDRVVQVIEQHGPLRGNVAVLKARNNPPSVNVRQPELLPSQYQRFTVPVSGADIESMFKLAVTAQESGQVALANLLRCLVSQAKPEDPSKSKIGAALKAGEAVAGCVLEQKKRLVIA